MVPSSNTAKVEDAAVKVYGESLRRYLGQYQGNLAVFGPGATSANIDSQRL
jgi:hypothetical protein